MPEGHMGTPLGHPFSKLILVNGWERNRSIFLALLTIALAAKARESTVIASKWPNIIAGAGSVKSSAGT